MHALFERFRTRIVPAALTAIGVALLAGGLLTYTNPVTAEPVPSADASVTPTPSPVAVTSTPSPLITLPPIGSAPPASANPSVPPNRVPTRVRIAALKIDLPVIRQPDVSYPACNVAMWYQDRRLGMPGQGKATYIYAHARTGMFLPLLDQSQVQNGKKMLGMVVELWTNDDQKFLYVITDVRRHVPTTSAFIAPFAAKTEQLWLQTSEGRGPMPKLQLVAEPLSQEAAPHDEANPVPHPVNCR
jgi:hypothetical protein